VGSSGVVTVNAVKKAFYLAKDKRDDDAAAEIVEAAFVKVCELESRLDPPFSSGGLWSFRALKQAVRLHLRLHLSFPCPDAVVRSYRDLLSFFRRVDADGANVFFAVRPNMIEKAVTKMLDLAASSFPAGEGPEGALGYLYSATLDAFRRPAGTGAFDGGHDRLWFRTKLRLGQLCYESGDDHGLRSAVRDLLESRGEPPEDDDAAPADLRGRPGSALCPGFAAEPSRRPRLPQPAPAAGRAPATSLLEIYALMIQLYGRTGDHGRLRDLYVRSQRVEGGIPHPRTLAVIKECGGKMYMREREFDNARRAFFDAFRSYDEAGDPGRLRCLKYQVLASMLFESGINPFDAAEARPFKDHDEIVAMTDLVRAYHDGDVKTFERVLQRNQGKIMDDPFIRTYIDDLLKTVRTRVLLRVLQPYTRTTLQFLSHQLNGVPPDDVENLLSQLILEGRLHGQIDQDNGILYRKMPQDPSLKNAKAMDDLTAAMKKMTSGLIAAVDSAITIGGDKMGRGQRWGD